MYLQSRIQEQLENQDKLTKTSKTFEQRYIFSFFSFANQTLENSHPKNPNSSHSPQNKNPQNLEKLEKYFQKQEDVLVSKIKNYDKKLRDKYEELKILESFSNPINQILVSKIKEYQINVLNSKISNQDVFFNNENESKKVNSIF